MSLTQLQKNHTNIRGSPVFIVTKETIIFTVADMELEVVMKVMAKVWEEVSDLGTGMEVVMKVMAKVWEEEMGMGWETFTMTTVVVVLSVMAMAWVMVAVMVEPMAGIIVETAVSELISMI